jgi:NAD(P)-dependent dehydrogenase (short-subunit alcohol dehydrogenase family)
MLIDRFRADGKVALVTGGTRGIGLAIAHALGEAGAKLVVTSRTDASGGLASLHSAGHQAHFIPADLTEPGAPESLIAATEARFGGLDILVNNAGVAAHGAAESFDDARLATVMDLNFTALFRTCRAAIPAMRKRGGGTIVNIGSISAMIANIPQDQAVYNASKAAVHMLTQSLGSELVRDNIRVNAIAPGYIETDMTRGGLAIPEWAKVWREMTPMDRVGQPEEIATAALFLATPASSYMTGAVMVIDGGYTTR